MGGIFRRLSGVALVCSTLSLSGCGLWSVNPHIPGLSSSSSSSSNDQGGRGTQGGTTPSTPATPAAPSDDAQPQSSKSVKQNVFASLREGKYKYVTAYSFYWGKPQGETIELDLKWPSGQDAQLVRKEGLNHGFRFSGTLTMISDLEKTGPRAAKITLRDYSISGEGHDDYWWGWNSHSPVERSNLDSFTQLGGLSEDFDLEVDKDSADRIILTRTLTSDDASYQVRVVLERESAKAQSAPTPAPAAQAPAPAPAQKTTFQRLKNGEYKFVRVDLFYRNSADGEKIEVDLGRADGQSTYDVKPRRTVGTNAGYTFYFEGMAMVTGLTKTGPAAAKVAISNYGVSGDGAGNVTYIERFGRTFDRSNLASFTDLGFAEDLQVDPVPGYPNRVILTRTEGTRSDRDGWIQIRVVLERVGAATESALVD